MVEEPEEDPDVRVSQQQRDKEVQDTREFYDGDKDQDNVTGTAVKVDKPVPMADA